MFDRNEHRGYGGAMTAVAGRVRRVVATSCVGPAWMTPFGTDGGMANGYFLAAGLGLALASEPSDAAAFRPASGLSVRILIIAGRRAYPSLVIGVVIGTITANLLSDRSLLTATFQGIKGA